MSDYFTVLSSLANWLNGPITDLSSRVGVPIFTALLLGLLGAASPCQLTTNISALAYISRRSYSPTLAWNSALAFILGKVLVYTFIGVLVIAVGLQLEQSAIPVIVVVRKALGPVLILIGLVLLGIVRFGFVVGQGISDWLASKAQGDKPRDSFLLGIAFAFAFCPTLFLLFFGVLMPLATRSRAGLFYPGVFAIGTALPLLLLLALFGASLQGVRAKLASVRRLDLYLQRAAGGIFVIAGLNEIVLYWLI